jgi:hypothetical protein
MIRAGAGDNISSHNELFGTSGQQLEMKISPWIWSASQKGEAHDP